MTAEVRQRLEALAVELAKLLGLDQGHIEVHYHDGKPKQVVTVDKGIKLGVGK